MKTTILIVTLFLILLAACAPAAQPPAAQPAAPATPTPSQPPAAQPATPPAEVQPGPTPAETQPMPVATKELQDLLSRADQKLKSYKYLELVLPDKKQPDTIFVKGDKIKISLYPYEPYMIENYFDAVYLDTAKKTAVGRCESRQRCIWPKGDNTKRDFTGLDYDRYRSKTPYEWLKSVPVTASIIGPEVHSNRGTTKIEYGEAGKTIYVWIDDNYGLPVEIWVVPSSGEKTQYKFNDMDFNGVSDEDVMPPALA